MKINEHRTRGKEVQNKLFRIKASINISENKESKCWFSKKHNKMDKMSMRVIKRKKQ